jgi:hypothetical protein
MLDFSATYLSLLFMMPRTFCMGSVAAPLVDEDPPLLFFASISHLFLLFSSIHKSLPCVPRSSTQRSRFQYY